MGDGSQQSRQREAGGRGLSPGWGRPLRSILENLGIMASRTRREVASLQRPASKTILRQRDNPKQSSQEHGTVIQRLRIKNYKGIRDVSIEIGTTHALIGPNDSGKTSILQAVAALCRSVDHELARAFVGAWEGRDLAWRGQDVPVTLGASLSDEKGAFEYDLVCRFGPSHKNVHTEREEIRESGPSGRVHPLTPGSNQSMVCHNHPSSAGTDDVAAARRVHNALSGVQFCRWNPRFLALPVAPQEQQRFWMDPSGFGLALLLEDILGENRSLFEKIEDRFRRFFPHVKSIRLQREPGFTAPSEYNQELPELRHAAGKGLHFEFSTGQVVRASQVSDGVLLVLGYLTILHLPKPPRVVLVEEPENGVHPKRLRDVLNILRELASEQGHSQVLLTTPSPYVVDLFKPNEVSLCRLGSDGSVSVTRLSDSNVVLSQLDIFTLGEIWTAEGDEELVDKSPSAESTSD